MIQAPWTRLNREQSQKVLQQIAARPDGVVFSGNYTEVSHQRLPFYTNYWLCRLVNYATMPTFSMTYFCDGSAFIALDGTANPIYTVNEKDPIRLDETNVIPYLEFFFSNVQGSEGEVFMIHEGDKMPFLEALSPAQQQAIQGGFKPLHAVHDPLKKHFKVTGTLYYGGGLIVATIVVLPDGKISFAEQKLLLTGVPFPDSYSYRQASFEG